MRSSAIEYSSSVRAPASKAARSLDSLSSLSVATTLSSGTRPPQPDGQAQYAFTPAGSTQTCSHASTLQQRAMSGPMAFVASRNTSPPSMTFLWRDASGVSQVAHWPSPPPITPAVRRICW